MTSPRSIAGVAWPWSVAATLLGADRNHIGANSYGRPGRYRRDDLVLSEPAKTSAATVPMTAAGMIT
ncbi:hypothetical protein BXY51_000792 [Actinoplanes cyaneus]|nr:hypothetical protein [Actinoplanes cyaneus]